MNNRAALYEQYSEASDFKFEMELVNITKCEPLYFIIDELDKGKRILRSLFYRQIGIATLKTIYSHPQDEDMTEIKPAFEQIGCFHNDKFIYMHDFGTRYLFQELEHYFETMDEKYNIKIVSETKFYEIIGGSQNE